MKTFVFPDASIFLHFWTPDKFDLPELVEDAEVTFLLTLAVTEELLHHQQNHPVREQRRHAKAILKQVEKWLEGQNAPGSGVTVSFIGRQPGIETMERYHLNWQNKDDVLLGTMLEYKKVYPDKAVILLAGNSNLADRARSLGIEVAFPPDEHKFAEAEHTQVEDEQNLSQELTGLRYRTPDLSLSFSGGIDRMTISIEPQLDSLTPIMQAQLVAVVDKMRHEAAQYQADDAIEAALDDLNTIANLVAQMLPVGSRSSPGGMAEEEAERYQREIEAYPEKFERYLHRCLEIINLHRRTVRLDLELENRGGGAAEDVLLMLTLPDQLEWHWQPNNRDMPAPPAPPTAPELEGQALERSFHIGRVTLVPSDLRGEGIFGDTSAGATPMISEEGTQIQWELGTYRHHQSRLLEPLYGRFRHADDITDFIIAWEIREKKSPGPVRGQLFVSIDTKMSAGEVYG